MKPTCCSIHTHSVLCDGKDTLARMAEAAFRAGVRYFGASGHSHTELPWDKGNVLSADLTAYRTEVLRLREAYRGRMEILLGLEWDSCSDDMPQDVDYWIGSVHNLRDNTGTPWCIDWDEGRLAACCIQGFHGDFPALIRRYYHDAAEVASKKPTVLGHLDLITKFNEGGALFDETDRGYQQAALYALHAADPSATVLEINTGAISRGYRTVPYPALFLLQEWHRMGGQVVLTADAHSADTVVSHYDLAAEAARAAGFRSTVVLTAQGWQDCPLETEK